MHQVRLPRRSRAVALATVSAVAAPLVGCEWVDSTGRQPGEGSAPIEIMLDQIAPGEPLVVDEERARRLDLARLAEPGESYTWSEDPLAEGALDSCAAVPGFRPALAAATLAEACTDAEACAFGFERDPPVEEAPPADPSDELPPDGPPVDGGEGLPAGEGDGSGEALGFVVVAPRLRAPIGLRYRLTVETADGRTGSSDYDFCLIAINEAPEAVDDGPYVVVEGTTLVIGADDPGNLLLNDEDDDDVGNAGLRVEPVPTRAPSLSEAFELRADGGFTYAFPDVGIRGSIADSFDYVVTDGSMTSSEATVRLTIVPRDQAPVLQVPLDPLEAVVGEPFEADLGVGFSDPEGGSLVFFPLPGSLPASGSLTLDEGGLLSGEPLAEDVGVYDIDFVASDGVRETEGRVELRIDEPPNAAPVYVVGSIEDIAVPVNRFINPVTVEFVDPDDDPLAFELIGELPRGLGFDTATGRLFGRPRERGDFTGLQILASDPEGASGRSIVFSILVF